MLKATMILSLLVLLSCASSNKTGDQKADAVIEHVSKGSKIIGQDWDEKFTKDGFIDGEYIAIGTASSANLAYHNKPLRLAAETDAMVRLLRSAPTDYKRVVQKVLNSLGNNDGAASESMVSITEVRALTGMRSNFDDIQCIKTAIPTQDLKWSYAKECRLILRIDATKLAEAYDFTLNKKYSIKNKDEIENLVNKELSGRSNELSNND